MTDHKPTGQTHVIETVSDFAKVVTESNLPNLIQDFTFSLKMHMAMNELARAGAELRKAEFEPVVFKSFEWIDDGEHHIAAKLIPRNDSEKARPK